MAEEEISPITFEQLAAIEDEFDAVDLEIMRQQYKLSQPLYTKRAEVVAKIPHFWALVFEQAPPEIDSLITPVDAKILADHLKDMTVSRPEVEGGADGHPRSFDIRFEFTPNEYFEDTVLEKRFSYRRAKDTWTGLVSEPVKIHWKKGKDITESLTDLAVDLFAARNKAGDMKSKTLPEYEALRTKVESWNAANTSFFTWFGFVSEYRWVSAEESAEANREYAAKREAAKQRGDAPADEDEDDEDDEDFEADEDVEVCENGEDFAISLADDLWPNAIKFFTGMHDMDDMSDIDFEEMDEDDEDDEDEDGAVDMRTLVENGEGPPAKKKAKTQA